MTRGINMKLFPTLKRNSRLALRGSFGRAIVILLITMGVSTLISALAQVAMSMFAGPVNYVTAALNDADMTFLKMLAGFRMNPAEWIIISAVTVVSVLLMAPLSLGAIRWYYSLVHGEPLSVAELFYFFESGKLYARSIFYEINMSVRSLLWLVLFYGPPSAVYGISMYFLNGGEERAREALITATAGIFLSAILFILATLFYAACICRYALTPYLIAEDGDLTVRQAIKLSVKYTKGFRFSIIWFAASYAGWFLLMLIAFMIPVFYVVPYYSTGMAMYSRFIIEKNRGGISGETREVTVSDGESAANRR